MNKLIDIVISGAVTGAIYGLMAAGLVLTYQTAGIFNFAHGAVAFTVAYLYYQLHVGQDIPIVPSLIIAVFIFAPLLGLLLDRVLLRRLAHAPVYARIVGTIGLLVALPNLANWLVEAVGNGLLGLGLPTNKADQGNIQPPGIGPSPPKTVRITDNVALSTDQLAVLICAVLAAIVLWYVLRRTRIGLEMRAVVDRSELAQLRGVNASRSSAVSWILTMILAGLGGVLIAPLFSLEETTITFIVLGSLAAVALARLHSIPVALLGGLLLGVVANLVAGYSSNVLPDFLSNLSGLRTSVPYVITLLLLMFWVASRKRGRQAGTTADDVPRPDHRVGLPAWRRRLPWVIATLALVVFSLGWIDVPALQADSYEQGIIVLGLTMGLIFLSFVVITGMAGQVSLAQATFVTAGGLAAGWALNYDWGVDLPLVANHGQLNFLVAALFGALVGAGTGALVALPVRRLAGVSLAIGTLAIAFAADVLVFAQDGFNNQSSGWTVRTPTLDLPGVNWLNDVLLKGGHQPFVDLSDVRDQILVMLVLFGAVTAIVHAVTRSPSGRAAYAVRSSEVAAEASGIKSGRTKVRFFAFSGAIAGFAGVFLGMQTFIFSDKSAPPYVTLFWLSLAVTFGIRRPGGALLAGLALACSPAIFHWLATDILPQGSVSDLVGSIYFVPILSGLGAINLAQEPDGILALTGQQLLAKRRKKQRAAAIAAAEATVHDGTVPEHEQDHVTTGAPATPDGSVTAPDGAATLDGAALALDRVVAGYGDVEVLHGVSLGIAPGQIVALLGANGAGKSTFCSVASGLLEPYTGRVLVDGDDVTKTLPFERAKRLGLQLVPEARGIFPGLSVEDNLTVLLRDPALREAAFDRFPILRERRKQPAGLLSGGEQQMLSLAPALVDPPKVLIADEPTLGLAPLAANLVMNAIVELRDRGCAVLLVEEHARNALEVADVIAYMELGRIVWCGPRAEADLHLLAASYLGGGAPSDAQS
jgi:ABC-type branched-subunit amino acid transport system ATPase component/branched-subunit amino acid ABC-type transport system permease component